MLASPSGTRNAMASFALKCSKSVVFLDPHTGQAALLRSMDCTTLDMAVDGRKVKETWRTLRPPALLVCHPEYACRSELLFVPHIFGALKYMGLWLHTGTLMQATGPSCERYRPRRLSIISLS
jgi:hypothetical protein